jgi:hypothetical protein
MANLGVPIKLMHESLGHIVTVELKTGEVSWMSTDRLGSQLIVSDVQGEADGGYVGRLPAKKTRLTRCFPSPLRPSSSYRSLWLIDTPFSPLIDIT